jgi:phosphoribosylformylglycinamidine cyclo-ligase
MSQIDRAYERLGVRSDKGGVTDGLPQLTGRIFPGAFCQILPDYFAQDDAFAMAVHADGVGSKSIFAYLLAVAHGVRSAYRLLAWDSLAMNLDDVACAGFTGPFLASNVVNRNLFEVDDHACGEIIGGYSDVADVLLPFGTVVRLTGGETADLGDVVRTCSVDSTIVARQLRKTLVDISRVGPGLDIIGLGVEGRAAWESAENSGVMSNGISFLRHHLLSRRYTEFGSSFDPCIESDAYRGDYLLTDRLGELETDLGTALTSPSRIYAPLLKALLENFLEPVIGMVHVTGGGLTKSIKFGSPARHVKDNLFPRPRIQQMAAESAGVCLAEIAPILNLGHGIEIFVDPKASEDILQFIASTGFGIPAQLIGRTEHSDVAEVQVTTGGESASYRLAAGRVGLLPPSV